MKNSLSAKTRLMAEDATPEPFDGFVFRWIGKCRAEDVLAVRNAPHVVAQMADPREIGVEEHAAFLLGYDKLDRMDFILFHQKTDAPVGGFSLVVGEYGVEIGKYVGNRDFAGAGIGFKATRQLLAYCDQVLHLDEVFSRTRRTNEANIHVNKKLGFGESQLQNDDFLVMEKIFE